MQSPERLDVWIYSLVSVTAVSLLSFVGALLLGMNRKRLHRLTTYLVSLAVGALLGGAFLHLIPTALGAFENQQTVWLLVIGGFFASFLIETLIGGHSHAHTHDLDPYVGPERRGEERPHKPAMIGVVLIGDAAHNFLDGILIAGAFLLDPRIGVVTTLIVILHELPQEFGDFGVLISGGFSIGRALKWNLITAAAAIAGAIIALAIGTSVDAFADVIVPLAAGNFIYIAGADLVPHLHEKKSSTPALVAVALLGVLLMVWIHHATEDLLPGEHDHDHGAIHSESIP